ncbi:uncharacterized protein LOC134823134 [Bolinopsis microptera]|uniref:uncharacterized protein LOC134823134 n=1 Tax=Bolinopsis microptera TaxID=2820187 RepID=UPI003079142B
MDRFLATLNKLQDVFTTAGVSSKEIDLPQIVVVGSQSTGKSSVLENIAKQNFLPRGMGIVTRRPLVLQMIQAASKKVISGKTHDTWAQFLHQGDKFYTNMDSIQKEIIDDTNKKCGSNKGISNDPIHLKLYSTRIPSLTLVDLPGLTKIPVGDQPRDIDQRIESLVRSYIVNENSIILAVSAGNVDIANSDSLKLAREVDPTGSRTIAVITKCDLMENNDESSAVLNGTSVDVKLGLIGVINRNNKQLTVKTPIEKILAIEENYFLRYYPGIADRMDDTRSSKNFSPPGPPVPSVVDAPKSNPVMSHDNGHDEAPDILSKVEHLMRANNSALLESFREEMHSIIVDKLALCAPASEHLLEEQVSNVNKENLQSRSPSALSSYSNFAEALVGGASSPQPSKVSANINQIGKESKEILVLDSPLPSADISSAPDVLSELLYDTRLIAMKTSLLDSHKKITLVFPSSSDRLKAKSLIENSDVIKLLGFHITLSQKALPKVTVSNIPSQIFETIDRSGLPAEDFRLQTKKALLDIIPLKNPGLKHLLDNEHFFEIVYINVGLRFSSSVSQNSFL